MEAFSDVELSRPLRPERLFLFFNIVPPQRGIFNVAWGNAPGNMDPIQTTLEGLLNGHPACDTLKKAFSL